MEQITQAEEKPKSETFRAPLPTVCVPVPLFDAMALCFYGEGPRHWELVKSTPGFKDLSPHPESTAGLFPPGLRVTDVPPDWKRVTTDDTSDVPTA